MTDPAPRFLIVRLSSIGDIVHALPAATALAQEFPQAEIDWVVEKCFAVLLDGNPHLHRILALDTLKWRKQFTSAATWQGLAACVGDLRKTHYDAALDFQGLWKSAVVTWLSRARERIGFASHQLREPSAAILYTHRVSPHPRLHVVEENMALVEHLGARALRWQFPLPQNEEDEAYVGRQIATLGSANFIIVNPGGGWRSKCWAPENYAALVREWASTRSEPVVLTGSAGEEPAIREILQSAGTPRAHFVPTTLVQFIAMARRARLFVGGDTGPLHLATAVGAPVVGIYGPTDPIRNGPFAANDIALTNHGPISHTRRGTAPEYLPGISVDTVLAAMEKRLARAYA